MMRLRAYFVSKRCHNTEFIIIIGVEFTYNCRREYEQKSVIKRDFRHKVDAVIHGIIAYIISIIVRPENAIRNNVSHVNLLKFQV